MTRFELWTSPLYFNILADKDLTEVKFKGTLYNPRKGTSLRAERRGAAEAVSTGTYRPRGRKILQTKQKKGGEKRARGQGAFPRCPGPRGGGTWPVHGVAGQPPVITFR